MKAFLSDPYVLPALVVGFLWGYAVKTISYWIHSWQHGKPYRKHKHQ